MERDWGLDNNINNTPLSITSQVFEARAYFKNSSSIYLPSPERIHFSVEYRFRCFWKLRGSFIVPLNGALPFLEKKCCSNNHRYYLLSII